MKKPLLKSFLIILLSLIICSCGNKGDLYMPDSEPKATTTDKTSE